MWFLRSKTSVENFVRIFQIILMHDPTRSSFHLRVFISSSFIEDYQNGISSGCVTITPVFSSYRINIPSKNAFSIILYTLHFPYFFPSDSGLHAIIHRFTFSRVWNIFGSASFFSYFSCPGRMTTLINLQRFAQSPPPVRDFSPEDFLHDAVEIIFTLPFLCFSS